MRRLDRDKRMVVTKNLLVITEWVGCDINGNSKYQVDMFHKDKNTYIGSYNMVPCGDRYEYIAEQAERIFNERYKK